ncbi:MAG: winged helix-turn-helix domain-containing protein [Candidatus Woesearchaeota archaeon]
MRELDDAEQRILKEIIRNPRISDNKISIITSIPIKTVNRKRKILEQEGILYYFASVNNLESGTGAFEASHLYIVILKNGITKKAVNEFFEKQEFNLHDFKHINFCYLGESSGSVVLVFIIESKKDEDISEIFNVDIYSKLKKEFGECIKEINVVKLNRTILMHHNYLLHKNVKNGRIDENWPSNMLFIE